MPVGSCHRVEFGPQLFTLTQAGAGYRLQGLADSDVPFREPTAATLDRRRQ